ncbi:MAG: class I SAM-dependent methyltransferase [Thermodesulfobacterium sp.]|nr:class I SAM-dependent methyltransferase [Thermodesulfobacterium sp.]
MNSKKHKHHHAGKSSRFIISASKVFDLLNLPKDIVFLDAGCGDGYFSLEASLRLGKESKIIAVDIHKESLDKLEKEIKDKGIKNIEILMTDITKRIPLEDESVDVYFMSNVLHGFDEEEKHKVINEAKRVLKKKGKIVVIEFKKEVTLVGPPIEIRISEKELSQLLERYGFQLERTYEISPYNYLYVFTSKE